jgi:hypothetical protein
MIPLPARVARANANGMRRKGETAFGWRQGNSTPEARVEFPRRLFL